MASQKDIFSSYESDNWYHRNKSILSDRLAHKAFTDINAIEKYTADNANVLEIGCANGIKLDYLQQLSPGKKLNLFGVDPSHESIKDGSETFRDLHLEIGTSDILNFKDEFFDVVIIGFCLYLIDRNLVFKTVSEVDRVLKPKGFLVITDFEPPFPYKKIYTHTEGVYSFKNNYANFFTGGGHYTLAQKQHYSLGGDVFDPAYNERVSTSILYKEDYEDLYKLVQ